MTDFNNFPAWANSGARTQPGFVAVGWTCGAVNPEHFNWWMNRADQALLDLEDRVVIAEGQAGKSLRGAYVLDSIAEFGVSSVGTPVVLRTFTHTIVHNFVRLRVGYDFTARMEAPSGGDCVVQYLLSLTSTVGPTSGYVISSQHGFDGNGVIGGNGGAGTDWRQWQGVHISKMIGATGHDFAGIGTTDPIPQFNSGDSVTLTLSANIVTGFSGTAYAVAPKIFLEEYGNHAI